MEMELFPKLHEGLAEGEFDTPEETGRFLVYFETGTDDRRRASVLSALALTDSLLSNYPSLDFLSCPVLVFRPPGSPDRNATFVKQVGLKVDGSLQPSGTAIPHTFLHELGHMWWSYKMGGARRKEFHDLVVGPPTRWPSRLPFAGGYDTPEQQTEECFAEWFAHLLIPEITSGYESHNDNVARLKEAPGIDVEEFAEVGGPDLRQRR